MRTRLLIAAALLAFIVFAIIAWGLVLRHNPVVHGQPESFWIESLEKGLRLEDFAEFQNSGTGAVSILLKALETEPNALDQVYSNAWSRLPASLKSKLPAPPKDAKDVNVRINASVQLALANPDIGTNIPLSVVARALRDPAWQVRMNALNCLTLVILPRSGPEKAGILPSIEAVAQDPYYQVRMCAANCLGFYRDASRRVAPILTNALKDNYPDVRIRAAMAFHALDPHIAEDAGAISVAFDCLKSGGIYGSQYLATNFLQKLGKLPLN